MTEETMSLLFQTTSAFHDITVDDNQDGAITLRIGGMRQSTLDSPDGFDAVQPIIDYLHLPIAAVPDAARALLIGLGGGVLPKRMWRDYPKLRIEVVEIDPVIVDVAHRFFGLPTDDERLRVHVGDGRHFVESSRDTYDIMVLDAYFKDAMPFGFATEEFFALASARLTDRGVMAYNLVSALSGERSTSMCRLLAGVRRHFAWAGIFPVGVECGGGRQNLVMMAAKRPIDTGALQERIRGCADGLITIRGFEGFGEGLVDAFALAEGAEPYRDGDPPADGMMRT
jgi:spermidine synthase